MKRILEVDVSCRDETIIRKAYLEKVKQYHPDSSFQNKKEDLEKFNQIQQAYEVLIVNMTKIFLVLVKKNCKTIV